ncbi:MAG: hypothetical protein RIC16_02995 [Rhodospirillales bacterium]
MRDDPVIIVHDKEQAVVALRAAADRNQTVLLLSARHAASSIGALVFIEIISQASRRVPAARFEAALDCGSAAGRAMAALRAGVGAIVFEPSAPAAERISDIAAKYGAKVLAASMYERPLLDLDTVGDPIRACDSYLNGGVGPDFL